MLMALSLIVSLMAAIPLTAGAEGPDEPYTCEVYDDSNDKVENPDDAGVFMMSFNEAFAVALANDGYTIVLLGDIYSEENYEISSSTVIIDTEENGCTLELPNELKCKGAGAALTVNGNISANLILENGGEATVNGDLFGFISSFGSGSDARVDGDVYSSWRGVYCGTGAKVAITGDLHGVDDGILAENGEVSVGGSVFAGSNGVAASGSGTVTIVGDVVAFYTIALAYNNAKVAIGGDAEGFYCIALACDNAKVTIDGDAYVHWGFIELEEEYYGPADYVLSSSPPGYMEYSNGRAAVLLKAPADKPTIRPLDDPPDAGMVGWLLEIKLRASGNPIDWTLTDAPEWLDIDDTGMLYGTPIATGSFDFKVTASNLAGTSDPMDMTIEVIEDPPYNSHDLDKLVAFAVQGSNLAELGWNLNDPQSWDFVWWEHDVYEDEWRLKQFDVYSCGLSLSGSLDLSGCTALTYLDFDNNGSGDLRLTSLDISGCTALRTVYCNGNTITDVNVTGCSGLGYINCMENRLTALDVSGCAVLEYLYCQFNRLTELSGLSDTMLWRLECNNNELTALPSLPATLTELYCYQNRLTGFDVTGLDDLEIIDCRYNYIGEEELDAPGTFVLGIDNLQPFIDIGEWDNCDTISDTYYDYRITPQHEPGFVAVTMILDLPKQATTNVPLALSGTIYPPDATAVLQGNAIEWELLDIDDDEIADAQLVGNVFTASSEGWAILLAVVENGTAADEAALFDFIIRVSDPVAKDEVITPTPKPPVDEPEEPDEPDEPDEPFVNPFMDVSEDAWYYEDVMFVLERGLMIGTSDDEFSPDGTFSRAMVVTILHRLAGEPDASGLENSFDDVEEDEWYTDAVKWAADCGIVNGYGNGLFGPDDPISRQDFAVVLVRYMSVMEINLPVTQQYIFFADEEDIADYAKDAIQTLNKLGVINGMGVNDAGLAIISPRSNATRAQAAALLHRFVTAIE